MGVIKNGKYYPDEKPEATTSSKTLKDIHLQGALRREGEKHAHNLIQPRNSDGTPNQDFIDHFPEDAKNYGFIPESEQE